MNNNPKSRMKTISGWAVSECEAEKIHKITIDGMICLHIMPSFLCCFLSRIIFFEK